MKLERHEIEENMEMNKDSRVSLIVRTINNGEVSFGEKTSQIYSSQFLPSNSVI